MSAWRITLPSGAVFKHIGGMSIESGALLLWSATDQWVPSKAYGAGAWLSVEREPDE